MKARAFHRYANAAPGEEASVTSAGTLPALAENASRDAESARSHDGSRADDRGVSSPSATPAETELRANEVSRHDGAHAGERRVSSALTSLAATELRADEVPRHAVRLVVVSRTGDAIAVHSFAALPELLRAGDLVVVNDAATLPGSLHGATARGEPIELRLAGPVDGSRLTGVLFGAGDHRTRTEHRPAPPPVAIGDSLVFGPLVVEVVRVTGGRRVEVVSRGETGDHLWQLLYMHGAPVQYAHRRERLPLYEVQTAYAARPWAAEMPSAGRPLTWEILLGLIRAGIGIATVTHAAGLSSTGDDALDRALPWPERYEIPRATALAVAAAKARGGRVIAVGTTVVRALESAAQGSELLAGGGVATLRLDAGYTPRVVDGLVSGLHVPGESHFELLQAFAPREQLSRALERAARDGLSSHELGDSCLVL